MGRHAVLLAAALATSMPAIVPGANCPYVHPTACAGEVPARLFALWAARHVQDPWDLLEVATDVLGSMYREKAGPAYSRSWPLAVDNWRDSCVSGYVLAMYSSSKGAKLQNWMMYELGMGLIAMCDFDEQLFFSVFGITPSQVAYVFFLLSHKIMWPHHVGNVWNPQAAAALLGIQVAEGGHGSGTKPSGLDASLSPFSPLVIDVGMGLGGDTRYYLAQGFRVVAVEANPQALVRATDEWLQPFVSSGQLAIVGAAVATKDADGDTKDFYTYPGRSEHSRAMPFSEDATGSERLVVPTVECVELLAFHGRAAYMKIDVEEETSECIRSLYQDWRRQDGKPAWQPPDYLSFEVENTGLVGTIVGWLRVLGYVSYKVVRQSVYSPQACELHEDEAEALGCGSGPFGEAAIDYIRGTAWRSLASLPSDIAWEREWGNNLDWFDIHVKRDA